MLPRKLILRLAVGRRYLRRRAATLKLREKLAAPYVALALMAAICGAAGLTVVHRIAGTVANLTDVTSPLLIVSVRLINNAHEMRSTYLDGMTQATTSVEDMLGRLFELDQNSRKHITDARPLAAQASLAPQFDEIAAQQQNFVATLRAMVDAYGRNQRANGAVIQRHARANAALEAVEAAVRSIGVQAEARIIENEETAKIQIQTGTATVDSLGGLLTETVSGEIPVLRYRYWLTRATLDLQHLSQDASDAQISTILAPTEGKVRDLLKTASGVARKLASRLRAVGDTRSVAAIEASLQNLEASLIGEQGLFAAKKEALAAAGNIQAGVSTLDRIDSLYMSILRDVESTVQARNEASKSGAKRAAKLGLITILSLVIASVLLAWGAGAYLRQAIVQPIKRVTNHVISNRGALVPIADTKVLRSGDEVGDLARAFNGMMGELLSARHELIARSEAEINKQVERLQAALKNMSQGLCMFDQDQRLVLANQQYADIYNVPAERIRPGMSLREIVAERVAAGSYVGDPQSHVDSYVVANTEAKRSNTVIELNNGRAIHIVKEPMKEGGWVATFEDVTERRQVEAKIAHMARHDALTGLPNRVLLREKMEDALTRVGRGDHIAVHCLDLDHFKDINDTLGHSIGDALLRAVTERLLGAVREHDTISRLGGDEFAIIQIVDSAEEATGLARRIIEALGQPFELDAHQVVIGTSIGIAIAPEDGRQCDELLKNADLALYRAKADGRNSYCFFEAEMDARMQARRKLELDLRKALVAGEFELFYQPLVHLASNRITGVEALLRWRHFERGLVSPAEFIPVLEEIALIAQVGEWILKEACRQAASWPGGIKVAVNLSPLQFKSPNLVTAVRTALTEADLPPSRLELEITETVLLEESEATLATLHQLKELGVTIAMDDFGTGYSSLSYLRSFPFDRIKIDRTFVRDIAERDDAVAIVRAVTTLSDSLGISTTAEGVETRAQLDKLRAEGCTDVQGYLFSPPKPASEIGALLDRPAGKNIAA
jgi:diguanylate cyclase (GGDEF)-like protein